jgi:hypothetical protein
MAGALGTGFPPGRASAPAVLRARQTSFGRKEVILMPAKKKKAAKKTSKKKK